MGNPRQDDLAPLADAVRGAYLTPPDEATQARHVAAMAEEARVIQHEAIPARPRARGLKGDLVTRFRTAAPLVKLAALTIIGAFATGGLATAGVIDLPDSLPGTASDRAEAVHDAIEGSDPSATSESPCAFGHSVAEAASDGTANTEADRCDAESANGEAGSQGSEKSEDARARGEANAQANGAEPEEGAGQAFGDSVSDRASGDGPTSTEGGGRDFGDTVSEEAQDLVTRPEPEAQGGPETGDSFSDQGQETGETQSQGGRDIAESHGGPPQD